MPNRSTDVPYRIGMLQQTRSVLDSFFMHPWQGTTLFTCYFINKNRQVIELKQGPPAEGKSSPTGYLQLLELSGCNTRPFIEQKAAYSALTVQVYPRCGSRWQTHAALHMYVALWQHIFRAPRRFILHSIGTLHMYEDRRDCYYCKSLCALL